MLQKVSTTLKMSYHLSELTGTDVLVGIFLDGAVHGYASAAFKPFFEEKDGRALFVSLLGPEIKLNNDMIRTAVLGPESEVGVDWEDGNQFQEVENIHFIEDDKEREETFRRLSLRLREMCLTLCPFNAPNTPQTEIQFVFCLATSSGKILSLASPLLKPLIASPAGQSLLTTLLNQSRVSNEVKNFVEKGGK